MFIKRKIRAGNTYTYRMLLSFKTSVTYNFLTSCRTGLSIMRQHIDRSGEVSDIKLSKSVKEVMFIFNTKPVY